MGRGLFFGIFYHRFLQLSQQTWLHLQSLCALSLSLSLVKDDRNHRLLTVLLGFVSHWALSFFPARRKDCVVPQRGGAQCSNPEMGIFPGMASTWVSGSSSPPPLSFLGFRLSI